MSAAQVKSARDISQELLERSGKALLARDFEMFMPCFHLPHSIETLHKKQTIETEDEFRALFDSVSQNYAKLHTTDLIRICDIAEFRTPTRIEATHTTHVMAGNHRVMDPYPCFAVIELIDARWLVTSSQYALDQNSSYGRAFDHKTRAAQPT